MVTPSPTYGERTDKSLTKDVFGFYTPPEIESLTIAILSVISPVYWATTTQSTFMTAIAAWQAIMLGGVVFTLFTVALNENSPRTAIVDFTYVNTLLLAAVAALGYGTYIGFIA